MFGLLDQARLERILALCPNLKGLLRAYSFNRPTSVIHRYPVALDTLNFSPMRAPVPAFCAAPMIEMINAPSIRHIFMLDSHMDAMTLVVAPLRAIVRTLFEFRDGYVELVAKREFLRCFHCCRFWGGKPFRPSHLHAAVHTLALAVSRPACWMHDTTRE